MTNLPKASVLVVDDREENLLAFSAVLANLGEIHTASSGPEALQQIDERPYAVVLLDVMMPGMDGFETASLLRQRPHGRHVPLVFITASYPSELRVFQGYSLGAVDYLHKPVSDVILRSKVAVFVNLYQQNERNRQLERAEAERAREAARLRTERERERKAAETAAIYQLFVQSVRDYAIFMMDLEGRITSWNAGAERILGFREKDVLGKSFSLIFTPEDVAAGLPQEELRRAAANGRAQDVRWHRRADRSLFWAEGIVSPLMTTNGIFGYCKLLHDATARKEREVQQATELALERSSADRVRRILSSITENYFVLDGEGRFVDINPQAEKVLGPREKILGKNFWELYPAASESLFFEEYRRALRDRTVRHFEGKSLITNAWYDTHVYPLGDGIEVYFRDISDRKVQQERQQQSEARLQMALRGARMVGWEWDLETNSVFQSGNVEELFGKRATKGDDFLAQVHPDDRAGMESRLRDAIARRASEYVSEYRLLHDVTGEVLWVEDRGGVTVSPDGPQHIGGVATDISERKRAEQALAEQARLLDLSADAIVVSEESSRIVYWNRGAEELFGWTRGEALGRNCRELLLTRFPLPEEEIQAQLERDGRWSGETLQRRKDGTSVIVASRWVLVRAEGDRPARVLETSTDISRRKAAEEKLRLLSQDLARSNRDLEHFASLASHDLQEPLRLISNYLGLIARRYWDSLDDTARGYLQVTLDSAKRMRNLIESLLAYSRLEPTSTPQWIESETLLQSALQNLRVRLTETKASVLNEPLPRVRGDAALLTQLFQNLIGNSVKFRRPGVPPKIAVFCRREGAEWIFTVKDNGIGFEMSEAPHVFELFHRLHRRADYEGSGIGLALCRRIVEGHGGRMWVHSEPGAGSEFSFSLPVGE